MPQALQIALLVNLAPRKLGSLEDWLLAIADDARDSGHSLTIFCHSPVHPQLREAIGSRGAVLDDLRSLRRNVARGVIRLARFDVIHLNLYGVRQPDALLAMAAWPARVLFVDHISIPPGLEEPRRWYHRLLDAITLARIAAIAGVSEYVAQRCRSRFRLGVERVRCIYLGVNLQRYQTPKRVSAHYGESIRCIAVASLIPEKGIDFAIRAVAELPWCTLDVVGDGPQRDQLNSLVRELGVANRVRFLGLRDDVPDLLRDADVFLHTAIWHEALGLVILEAMASGLPVIGSDIGAIPELVRHGITGFLVPPGDVAGVVQALRGLGQGDTRRVMGQAARARIASEFDVRQSARRHIEWCESAGSS